MAAFAPLSWWWLSFICLAIFFVLQLDASPRQAFWLGMSFGYGLYGVGVSWVYVSLHVYGGMPLWMGSVAVLLFAGLLATFIALPCWIAAINTVVGRPATRILLLATSWLVFEWGKSWVLTGFPWLDVGYTQTPSWLFGLAPLGGVYLVSLATLLISAAAALMWRLRRPHYIPISALVFTITLFVFAAVMGNQTWSQPAGDPVIVGVVQPNTPINQKWQPEYRDNVVRNLGRLSNELVAQQAQNQASLDLLVWPETALPLYYQQTDDAFWSALTPPQTGLITGLVDSPDFAQSYNAAVLSCDGAQQRYRKRHLVPFGEYMPLRFLFGWILDYLQLPMSDFASWSAPQDLQCGDLHIGLSICYEDAFAAELAHYSRNASVLINISEDAWFGRSLAPHQRLQMAQMRARELSRPMVRSANSGPSALIDHHGNVVIKTGQFEAASFSHEVAPQTGATPFQRYGNWIVWLCIATMALLIVGQRVLPRRRTKD